MRGVGVQRRVGGFGSLEVWKFRGLEDWRFGGLDGGV